MWLKNNTTLPELINLDEITKITIDGGSFSISGRYGYLSATLYRTAREDENGVARPATEMKAEAQNVFDYIQWCIEGEKTISVARPFLCDLSGTIPSKPFTFNPSSSSSNDDESDDDDDY